MEATVAQLSNTATKIKLLKYLKLQRQFLSLEGVLGKWMTGNKPPRRSGDRGKSRQDYTPTEFAELLGPVFNKFQAGGFDDLQPKIALEARFGQIQAFRGATLTARSRRARDAKIEEQRLLLKEVEEQVRADLALLSNSCAGGRGG